MNRLLLIIILSGLLIACQSPGVRSFSDLNTSNGRHWFEQLSEQKANSVSYLSPKQPYLSYYVSDMTAKPYIKSELPSNPVLSPGDRLRAWMPKSPLFSGVFNESDDEFSNIYEINIDGTIKLPYLSPVTAQGLTLEKLEHLLNKQMVDEGLFRKGMANLHLAIVEWAPITVFISGAVFSPGQVTINVRNPETRMLLRQNNSGDFPIERMLQAALKSAGGVRPDAELSQIEIIRHGKVYRVNIRGAMLGYPTGLLPLIDGDMIRVHSVGRPQLELITPSAITPPGIRVFISNLTRPAFDNASSAVGKHSSSLPYGSRLLTAVVSGNCAGGTVSTNSDRIAVLVSKDPVSQKAIAIERHIEDLLRAPNRIDLNPYLMPEDQVVCYDSRVTNIRDIGKAISDVLLPVNWLTRSITPW